jgi:DNA repair protein RadD
MNTPELRPYQEEAVEALRDAFRRSRRVLFTSPTGSGKTVMFVFMLARLIARGKRVCLLVHRRELVDQLHRYLEEVGIEHGIIAARYRGDFINRDALVQVASIPSLARRLVQYPQFDMLVVDEAHHSVSPSYLTILAAYPAAWVLGVTATPLRLDGKGLGDIYDALVCGKQIAELEELGFLARSAVYTTPAPDLSRIKMLAGDYTPGALAAVMSDGTLIGNAVEHWLKYASGQPTIAFGVSVAHSKLIERRFIEAGIPAAHIDGKSSDDDRRAAIEGLRTGAVLVLCNCGLISEGVDLPLLGAVIMLRPTRSLALYLQMVGRVARPYPGKDRAVVVDHCGNVHEHGLPNEPRRWSLDGAPPREKGQAPVKECPNCGVLIPLGCRICPHCSYLLVDNEIPKEQDGRLIKVDDTTLLIPRWLHPGSDYRKKLQWAGTNEKRLRAVAEICGYGRRWVEYRLADFRAGRL